METTSHPHAKIDLDTDLTLFPKINSKVEHRSNYKMQNYKITNMKQFKDNKYDFYYQKGLYYKRILYKVKNINEFLRNNSDTGEIMYLIYDIERCIDDYCKRKITKIGK